MSFIAQSGVNEIISDCNLLASILQHHLKLMFFRFYLSFL
ncbi:hypothetical protein PMAN_a3053 [Pseudoalteromonas marina]|nr:hypothetical protein PMAN_a3053 [Pseudoalteromonas marina]